MSKLFCLTYPSEAFQMTPHNELFDKCRIRICYTGENRNKSYLSKESIENAIPTLFNCPIVCNYNPAADTIGGHDSAFVKTESGVKMIALTDAVGVIPKDAVFYWETVDDHEYLCVEGIIWKRSAAYEKIKNDGFEAQSMEINVLDGRMQDGLYHIDKFQFTAFCLLGDGEEPCFEAAALEMFGLDECRARLSDMMDDFKKEFSRNFERQEGEAEDGDANAESDPEGGRAILGDKKYETDVLQPAAAEDADIANEADEAAFTVTAPDDMTLTIDAKKAVLDSSVFANAEDGEPAHEEPAGGNEVDAEAHDTFSLMGGQMVEEFYKILRTYTYNDPYWGEVTRYCFIDYDAEKGMVYAYDCANDITVRMPYSMDGDKIAVGFDEARRVKVVFEDFDEGTEQGARLFAAVSGDLKSASEKMIAVKDEEIKALREFKRAKEHEAFEAEANTLFEQFGDLESNEKFAELKSNHDGMSLEDIEEKCFALRGRMMQAKFSLENSEKPIRVAIERDQKKKKDEPYGGLFLKYGVGEE